MYTASIITREGDNIEDIMPLGLFFSKARLRNYGRKYIGRLLRANPNWFFVHKPEAENVLFSASNNSATVEIVVAEIPIGDSTEAIPNMAYAIC
jgi:hypothetical protein